MPKAKISKRAAKRKLLIGKAPTLKAKWDVSRDWERRKVKRNIALKIKQERSRKLAAQKEKTAKVSKRGLL